MKTNSVIVILLVLIAGKLGVFNFWPWVLYSGLALYSGISSIFTSGLIVPLLITVGLFTAKPMSEKSADVLFIGTGVVGTALAITLVVTRLFLMP